MRIGVKLKIWCLFLLVAVLLICMGMLYFMRHVMGVVALQNAADAPCFAEPLKTELLHSLNWAIMLDLGAIIALIIIISGSYFYITKNVLRPLADMRRMMLKIAAGSLDEQIQMNRNDEIGVLYESIGEMVNQWKKDLSAKTQSEQLLAKREAELVKAEEKFKAELAEQEHGNQLEIENARSVANALEKIFEVVTVPPKDLDQSVQSAMKLIGSIFSSDAAVIGRFDNEGKIIPSTYYYWMSGHYDQQYFLNNILAKSQPEMASSLLRDGYVVWESAAASPVGPGKKHKRGDLEVKAAAIVVFDTDDAGMNILGIACFGSERVWPPNVLDYLRTIGKAFFNTLGRRNMEAALYESKKRFRMIIEQAGEGFFLLDYDGRILDVNRRTCDELGWQRDELINVLISDVDTDIEIEKHKENIWINLQPGEYTSFESHHKRKDGTIFPVEVRLGRVDIGEDKFLLALARNITERKQKENELKTAFNEIMDLKDQLEQENIELRHEIELEHRHDAIVGKSEAIRDVLRQAEKVAGSDTCVLILGETGTGKELLAHAIHNMSPRKKRVMIKVNCAALPASLIESELFGREKGAYTGALTKQIGRFEAANGSTIFLDEIGDLPMEMQVKLLRVLQDGRFERLGSNESIFADVRIVAATNRNLLDLIKKGSFRKDLYYRLNVFPINVPPLRERQEDIPLLVKMFVNELNLKREKIVETIPKGTMKLLRNYSWPGNIRELKNVIERAMVLSPGSKLIVDRLDSEAEDAGSGQMGLDDITRIHITKVLESVGWRIYGKKGAAKILKLKPSTLQYKIKKLNIKKPDLV